METPYPNIMYVMCDHDYNVYTIFHILLSLATFMYRPQFAYLKPGTGRSTPLTIYGAKRETNF